MPEETIEENNPILGAGAEWHSDPIRLRRGQRAKLVVTGRRPVYAGLFKSSDYAAMRNKSGTTSKFKFGTDRATVVEEIVPDANDDYFLVVRNGVFTPRQSIRVRLSIDDSGAEPPAG